MKPLIWGESKAEYFSRGIWTGVIDLKARLKLAFRRKRFRGRNRLGKPQDR
jgi:hypothetical protein